jgi:uncharacterized cupredoxin-like copper-binding protein
MMDRAHPRQLLAALAAISLAIVGCTTNASPSPTAPGGGGGTTIAVTLQEWAVVPATNSAASGDVTFEVTNDGPADVHEFVVIRTDLDPAELPTDADGAVEEAGEGMEVVNEIEDIPVGETQELTVALDAGNYVLICNIFSADENEAHYEIGMRTAFTVTE